LRGRRPKNKVERCLKVKIAGERARPGKKTMEEPSNTSVVGARGIMTQKKPDVTLGPTEKQSAWEFDLGHKETGHPKKSKGGEQKKKQGLKNTGTAQEERKRKSARSTVIKTKWKAQWGKQKADRTNVHWKDTSILWLVQKRAKRIDGGEREKQNRHKKRPEKPPSVTKKVAPIMRRISG